jgi:hypothetical protein
MIHNKTLFSAHTMLIVRRTSLAHPCNCFICVHKTNNLNNNPAFFFLSLSLGGRLHHLRSLICCAEHNNIGAHSRIYVNNLILIILVPDLDPISNPSSEIIIRHNKPMSLQNRQSLNRFFTV